MSRQVLNGLKVIGSLLFGTAEDTNLYRAGADQLKTDDAFTVTGNLDALAAVNAAGPLTFGGDANLYRFSANLLKTDDSLIIADTLYVGADTNLYRSAADTLKTDDLLDASNAGLRTKHESGGTPTGGNSGELRVGTDKVWFQDTGTWKSIDVGGAATPSFASTVKWGTD